MYDLLESKDESKLDPNFKAKNNLHFYTIDINSKKALKYITKDWLNDKYGSIAICKEKDELSGYVYINKSGTIGPLRVYEKYRGYNVSKLLMNDAVYKYNGTKLGVYSDNQIAISLYKSYGFKVMKKKRYKDGDEVLIMER